MSQNDVCTWYGIKCNKNGYITEINLSGNRLSGVFPLEMATIGYGLLKLDISNNDIASFNGDLVWMSNMKVMVHLDIHSTNLDFVGVPPWLADMTALQYLDMSYTYFYGELDGTLFSKLTNLTHLDMAGNDYFGSTVPTQIAGLPKLQVLHIDFTEFGGDLSWMSILNTGIKEVWGRQQPMAGCYYSDYNWKACQPAIAFPLRESTRGDNPHPSWKPESNEEDVAL
jgi:hypothetical protein